MKHIYNFMKNRIIRYVQNEIAVIGPALSMQSCIKADYEGGL